MANNKGVLPVLFVTMLIDMVGISMLIPILPVIFTEPSSPAFMLAGWSTEAQYTIAGLLTALFGFVQFIASPVLGELSDVYGRKRLITLGVAVLALSQLVFGLGIAVGSLAVLFVSRAIAGVAASNFSIAQATIADVTEPHDRARNFGLIGAAVGLAFILGPFLGGTIAGLSGNAALPFFVAAGLGIVNVILVSTFLKETHHVRAEKRRITPLKAVNNIRAALKDHDARPVYAAGFLAMLGFAFYTSFIAILLAARFGFTETMTGTYFAIAGGWIIFAQVVVVRTLAKIYSDRTRLLIALPTLAVIIVAIPLVHASHWLYVFMPFLSSAFALVTTGVPSLVSKGVGPERQGAALGINGSLQALAQASAPLVAGFASGFLGLTAAFVIGAGCMLASFLIIVKRVARRT
ncbi:MAG TPA: MFS transporter [Candidatus Paceibacterota bacterium]|nr:MFS transporter [Candidatus Paceibacterota bacterium]